MGGAARQRDEKAWGKLRQRDRAGARFCAVTDVLPSCKTYRAKEGENDEELSSSSCVGVSEVGNSK